MKARSWDLSNAIASVEKEPIKIFRLNTGNSASTRRYYDTMYVMSLYIIDQILVMLVGQDYKKALVDMEHGRSYTTTSAKMSKISELPTFRSFLSHPFDRISHPAIASFLYSILARRYLYT